MKVCSKCNIEKNKSEFHKDKYKKSGVVSQCKPCRVDLTVEQRERKRIKNLEWTANNKEHIAARDKIYRQTVYKEREKYLNKKWALEHSERRAANSARRRAKKLNATPKWLTNEQKEYMTKYYSHAKVLEQMTGNKFHVDHIVPLQGKTVSGLNVPWNLQVLPAKENLSKANKLQENT